MSTTTRVATAAVAPSLSCQSATAASKATSRAVDDTVEQIATIHIQTVQTLASRRRRGRRAANDLEGRLVVKANAEWEASVDRAASRAAALDQTANRRECGPY